MSTTGGSEHTTACLAGERGEPCCPTTHTPGPFVKERHGKRIVVTADKGLVVVADCGEWASPLAHANGTLFAAAPETAAERDRLRGLLQEAVDFADNLATSSYCEWCRRHAPKSIEGELQGPIPHADNCWHHRARAALGLP